MRNRTLTVLAAAAVIAAVLTGCSSGAAGTADRQTALTDLKLDKDSSAAAMLPADIQKAGKLVIGVDPTYAPNEFKDKDGAPIGSA